VLKGLKRQVLGRAWDDFDLPRWRKRPGKVCPPSWATEGTQEVEQLRQTERHIAAATGWNSSTRVVGQLLRRLRGDRSGS
jgi:hypothetical protein